MDLKRDIGRRIRLLRETRGPVEQNARRRVSKMTIRHLAERAGLSADYVNKVELGQYQPTADTLYRLAGALEVDVAELFPTEHEGEGPSDRQRSLDTLRAFASQFSSDEVDYLLDVIRAVMRPQSTPATNAEHVGEDGGLSA